MGKLTTPTLQDYAKQYYKHVAAFPRYLSALHSKIDNFDDRKLILQNLIDEESGQENHPELWLRFCDALGLERKEVITTSYTPETNAFVNHFKLVTSKKGIAEGVAALYTYESQIPEVSEEKIKGLKEFYGVDSEEGLKYFKVHMHADIEHSKSERQLLKKYVTEDNQAKVLEVVNQTLDSYWGMLSGVQRMQIYNYYGK